MSHADEYGGQSPEFEQPSTDDVTLPLVDLYPTADSWTDSSPYASSQGQWNSASAPQPSAGDAAFYKAGMQPTQPTQQTGPYMQPYPQQPAQYMQQQSPYATQGPYIMVRPDHPNATAVLVLGAVSIAVPVLSFVAWYMGSKAKAEIERGAPFAYSGSLKAGHIIGKVMGILTIVGGSLYFVFLIGYLILMFSFLG